MDKSDDSAAVRNCLSRLLDLIYSYGAIHTKRFEEGRRIRVYNQPTLLYNLSEAAGCIREVHVCETLVGMHRGVHLRARKSVVPLPDQSEGEESGKLIRELRAHSYERYSSRLVSSEWIDWVNGCFGKWWLVSFWDWSIGNIASLADIPDLPDWSSSSRMT